MGINIHKSDGEQSALKITWSAMNRGPGNPLGLGLVIVGAFVMAISVFLPFDEPTGVFRMVRDNTLIQHGGWKFIGLALALAASGYRVSQERSSARWLPIILCIIGAGIVVLTANDTGLRTLYPVGPDGNPITTQPGMVANLGIAIYVAGAGIAAAFSGSVMLLQSAKPVSDASDDDQVDPRPSQSRQVQTKKCPDCAETILADAKVCKHCGYRFATGARADPQVLAPGKTSKVRCNKCQHVQVVPVGQSTFVCEQCNTKLTRKSKSAKST